MIVNAGIRSPSPIDETGWNNILDRLPVDRLEIRHIQNRGFLHVGRIARHVNMYPDAARTISLDLKAVDTAAFSTSPTYILDRRNIMPLPMALQPLLAFEADGKIFLLDGVHRAHSAFKHGLPVVKTRVVSHPLAIVLGADTLERESATHSGSHRLFEATRNRPVGARSFDEHTNVIVRLEASTDLPQHRPRLEDIEEILKQYLFYKTLCAVTREIVIAKEFRESRSVRIRNASNDSREQQIIYGWKKMYNLPISPPWKDVANRATQILRTCSDYQTKTELNHAIKAEMLRLGENEAVKLRDLEVRERNVLLKAFHHAHQSILRARELVKYEGEGNDISMISKASRVFETPLDQKAILDINDQIILSKAYAINPTSFCFGHTRYDALFEAYAFACRCRNGCREPASASMVETYLQRKALAAAPWLNAPEPQPQHISCRLWQDVFEHYEEQGLSNLITADVLREMDQMGVYDGPPPGNLVGHDVI